SSVMSLGEETRARGDTSWETASFAWAFDRSLEGRDGRFDFEHFWLYPLLASPAVAIARALHVHPAAGFTALNLALLILLVGLIARRGGREIAVLVACLMLWWVDKAHAEV